VNKDQHHPALRVRLLILVLLAGSAVAANAAATPPVDEASGLIIDEHWELVKAHCTVCHSAGQVTQQRGSRDTWTSLIRWMQNTQGLWQFDVVTENSILDYLEKNYPPAASYRRAPLAPDLLPPPGAASG
jgi:hypothetical protein